MDEKRKGPADIPTSERMRDVGAAMFSAMGKKSSGELEAEQSGARLRLTESDVQGLTADWPKAPKLSVEQTMKQYGPPNEGTPARLIWYNSGPWKRVEITRDEIEHNFPAPHTDYMTCWIDYQVPIEFADELTRYDGSCLIDRTAGEVGARCDGEAADMVTINFMHEIVTGKKTVEEAREAYAEQLSAYLLGRPAPYAEGLLFDPPRGGTVDPDETIMPPHMLNQLKEKLKDAVA
ncbi:MAG: hypothetical protein HOP95_01835 [Sphingomonas sp.]|nr:hypothetical protein [Sphingomonas sp.]